MASCCLRTSRGFFPEVEAGAVGLEGGWLGPTSQISLAPFLGQSRPLFVGHPDLYVSTSRFTSDPQTIQSLDVSCSDWGAFGSWQQETRACGRAAPGPWARWDACLSRLGSSVTAVFWCGHRVNTAPSWPSMLPPEKASPSHPVTGLWAEAETKALGGNSHWGPSLCPSGDHTPDVGSPWLPGRSWEHPPSPVIGNWKLPGRRL